MASTLVILGAVGDLTGRYLVPALVELHERGELPDDLAIVGVARKDLSDDAYRRQLRDDLDDLGTRDPSAADAVLQRISYVEADATDSAALQALPVDGEGPVIMYMALPPAVFADAFQAIADSGLGDRVRLAIEKPFGENLASARELNGVLDRCVDASQVFRVDHFLGSPIARRLFELRRSPLLASAWSAAHIAAIELVWDETIALEGRAGYYDDAGALVDMLQNHLLQLMAIVAMEPVEETEEVPAARLEVFRRVEARPDRSVRGRYTHGTVEGRDVSAYVDEEGVDADRCTETFAEIELAIEGPRWEGVPVRLRTGKAMGEDRSCIVVRFRNSTDELLLDAETKTLSLRLGELTLESALPGGDPSAYARVLRDLFAGDPCWFVSAPEAEEQWRIVEPVLDRWAAGEPPIVEYPAGTSGPGR